MGHCLGLMAPFLDSFVVFMECEASSPEQYDKKYEISLKIHFKTGTI